MKIKYNLNIQQKIVTKHLTYIINQVYKLLPMRQQDKEWKKLLQSIIQQLLGMKRLFLYNQDIEENFFILLCKLQGLFELTQQENFSLYRRIIFQCLNLLGDIKQCLA